MTFEELRNGFDKINKDIKYVYVAHPYNGKTKTFEEHALNMQSITYLMTELVYNQNFSDCVFISPLHLFSYMAQHKDTSYRVVIDDCIRILSKCDAIILYNGPMSTWKDSTGCVTEYNYAKSHNISIFEEEEK